MLGAFVSNTLSAVAIVFRANLEDFSIEFKLGKIKSVAWNYKVLVLLLSEPKSDTLAWSCSAAQLHFVKVYELMRKTLKSASHLLFELEYLLVFLARFNNREKVRGNMETTCNVV